MEKIRSANAWQNWVGALAIFLAGFGVSGQENLVPAPRTEAEIQKMMSITEDLHILPPGVRPEMLEHLLEIGEVVVYFDHSLKVPWMSAAGILVDAPVDQVFAVLTDYTHYPSFVPMTEAAEVQKIANNLVRVDFHLNVQMSFLHYRLDYGVYHHWQPPYRSDWSHAWGEFGINTGFAELVPASSGKRTMFFYSVYSEPRSKFLKSLYAREPSLEMMTSLSTATVFVRAIKAEAEKRSAAAGCKAAGAGKPRHIFDVLAEDPGGMKKMLEQGNLLVLEDGPTVYVVSGGLVDAPIAQAYAVISDFEKQPEFVPGVKKAKHLAATQAGDTFQWELEFDLAFFRYLQTPLWTYNYSAPELITWDILRPCCGRVQGFWKLLPLGDQTLIFNGSSADIRSMGFIPRYALDKEPTLEHAALASQALLVVNAMKQRIAQKFGRQTSLPKE